MADLRVGNFVHEFDCPYCQQRTRHISPAGTILFANIKCEYCGQSLVIVQNELWEPDQKSKSRSA